VIKEPDKEGKNGEKVRLDACSLYIFDQSLDIRKNMVRLTEWKWFDRFIMLVIVLNSVMLCA
jgi:hypothetical protein